MSSKNLSCEICGSRKDSLFSCLDSKSCETLNEHKTTQNYKKNQSVFIEGSSPRGVFCLNSGKVKIYVLGNEGKEQIIHIANEGEIIGFRALLSNEPYQLSATCIEDCQICYIPKEDFLGMVDTSSALRNSVLQELSRELKERAKFITNLAQKSVRERLAQVLIELNDIYKDQPINLSREDLSNFVGTATETVIRLIKDFKSEGLIETDVRKIQIIDIDRLKLVQEGRF